MKTLAHCGMFMAVILAAGAAVQNQGARKVEGVVVAAPTGSLSASFRPVAGARVEYEERGTGDAQVATTDDKGRFEFPSGRQGVVTAIKSGFATISMGWPPRNGGAQLRVVLPHPATVRGTLFDMATKRAVLDGAVTLIVDHPANLVSDAAHVENGRFEFEALPPGPAILVANADGFAPHFSTLTIDAGKTHALRIGLLLEGAVRGSVLDASGALVTGAVLSVVYDSAFAPGALLESFVGGRLVTGDDGMFAVERIVPDTSFRLYAEGEQGGRSEVVTLTVSPGLPLEGVVLRMR